MQHEIVAHLLWSSADGRGVRMNLPLCRHLEVELMLQRARLEAVLRADRLVVPAARDFLVDNVYKLPHGAAEQGQAALGHRFPTCTFHACVFNALSVTCPYEGFSLTMSPPSAPQAQASSHISAWASSILA
ncbi:hypothetical protein PsYK624_102450 [Phanerochaete sordida]|uniref:Uncharacterized protein n=1 Tax=Phanerochaete sordida TaxID=48140 RepID=A0A9P3LHF3_9APHY|nr:hypothetical protein PsYK624_102450 [Phanerochaete sordida]